MNTISAIIIVKNAHNLIGDCIRSIQFCNEIIIVDNQSSDGTSQVARNQGAHVYTNTSSNFSTLRNFGLSKAKGEWVLYVDADERVSEQLQKNILQIMLPQKKIQHVAYKLQRENFYLGNHPWPAVETIERLFQKKALQGWRGSLHESPIVQGEVGILDGYLFHYSHQDLHSMLVKTIEWSKTEAELRLKENHPKMTWWRFPRVMLTAFFDSYIRQGGYKIGTAGIIESIYQSFSMFITYARLWEMQKRESDHNR